jgi:hypothetical protein
MPLLRGCAFLAEALCWEWLVMAGHHRLLSATSGRSTDTIEAVVEINGSGYAGKSRRSNELYQGPQKEKNC